MTLIIKAAVIGWATGVSLGALVAGVAWAAAEGGHGYRLDRSTR